MKKLMTITLLLAAALSMLAGCTNGGMNPPQGQLELRRFLEGLN